VAVFLDHAGGYERLQDLLHSLLAVPGPDGNAGQVVHHIGVTVEERQDVVAFGPVDQPLQRLQHFLQRFLAGEQHPIEEHQALLEQVGQRWIAPQ
jgi:hypothetical protein